MDYIYDEKELQRLIKEIDNKISDIDKANINKELLNDVADEVIPIIKNKAPVSENHEKSGVYRNGKRITPKKNAKEYINKSNIKKKKDFFSLTIGLEGNENDIGYAFYIKFEEFGTSKIKPNSFMRPGYDKAYSLLKKKAIEKYTDILNKL